MHVAVYGDGRLYVSSGDDIETWAFSDRDARVLRETLSWCAERGMVPEHEIPQIVGCIRACSDLDRALRAMTVSGYWLDWNDGLVMYRWANYDVNEYEGSGEVVFTATGTPARERAAE